MQTSTSSIPKVKFGVLGTSSFAIDKVLPNVLSHDSRFRLSGLATETRGKYEDAMLRLGTGEAGCSWYPSYEALIDSDEIQAVYIPLPNSLHEHYVEGALKNRKHVLVEKPATWNYKSALKLCNLAEVNGVVLMENFHFLHHKQLNALRDVISSGGIGEIRSVSSAFSFNLPSSAAKIRLNKNLGGGALLDAGVYPLRMGIELLGEGISVAFLQGKFCSESEVDLGGSGLLVNPDCSICMHFDFSFEAFYQCRLDILGSRGRLSAERVYTCPPNYSPKLQIQMGEEMKLIDIGLDNQYLNMLNHFHACIEDTEKAKAELRNIINQARVLNDAIKKRDLSDVHIVGTTF